MKNRGDYFISRGFREDPFASTNALQEKLLEECFIVPPYYYSLIGSINEPKSSFVTAPRGTGKTAQRVMIEHDSEKNSGMIAIVYDDFPIENYNDAEQVTLEDHMIRIIKTLILSFLSELDKCCFKNPIDIYDKKQLRKLIELYLSGINPVEINNAISKIRGIEGKIENIWCKTGKTITSIINAILQKIGAGSITLDNEKKINGINIADIKSHLDFIEHLFNSIGITAVYVLVDSIDETVLTGNNAEKSFHLIKPFILDLRLLERKTIVFKFFVWDKIKNYWADVFREDRIEHFEIKWTQEKIKELIDARIRGYSNGKYTSIKDILECDDSIIQLIYNFSCNSPRDAINIMKSIFDEHLLDVNNYEKIPNSQTVIKGIDNFCETKFVELVPNEKQRKQLKRIKIATFTIPYLYNDIFKCESSTARNILMPWTQSGIVIPSNNKIKVNKSSNAINIYTFSDIRVARVVCSNIQFGDFVNRNMCICPECNCVNVFDKKNAYEINYWQCKNCQCELMDKSISKNKVKSKEHITVRKKNNSDISGQMSLWDII